MRTFLSLLAGSTMLSAVFTAGVAHAATVYPLDRATILAGSPFDFKVEFEGAVKPEDIKLTINGEDYKTVLGSEGDFVGMEKGKDDKELGSAIILRQLKLDKAGDYKVEVSAGDQSKSVVWTVYDTAATPKAKNIIFMVGDGLSVAHRCTHHV